MKSNYHIRAIIFFVLLLICNIPFVLAQSEGNSKKEKIEALRIAFITQHLDLSTKEAQAFWPLYNEYLDKMELVRNTFKQNYGKKADFDFKTDKEAEAYINAEINLKLKEAEYFKEYYEKIKKVLSIKKVAMLRRAEEDFKKELLRQIQNKETFN